MFCLLKMIKKKVYISKHNPNRENKIIFLMIEDGEK